jgi:hypothetical protein
LLVNVDFSRPGIPRSGERHPLIVSRANGIHAVPGRKLENSSSQLLTLMIKADQPHINYCIPAKRNETLLSEMSLAAQGNP